MTSTLWFLAIIAVCGLCLWFAFRIEPHWASKDGSRFVCFGQALTSHGVPIGRWREMRISRVGGDSLEVRPRRGSLTMDKTSMPSPKSMLTRRNTKASYWKVIGRTQEHRNKVIYMLNGSNDADLPAMIALRLPSKSRAVKTLEELAVNKSTATRPATETMPSEAATSEATTSSATQATSTARPSQPSPGTQQSVVPPDQD